MSADNWRVCPKCQKQQNDKRDKVLADAEKLYGKVSAKEYLDAMKAASVEQELEDTLREDYEVRVEDNGEFQLDYRASCIVCGFRFQKKMNEQVPLD